MTNVAWDFIEKYNDISSRGQYELALNEGFSADQALDFVHFFSYDNAGTPTPALRAGKRGSRFTTTTKLATRLWKTATRILS